MCQQFSKLVGSKQGYCNYNQAQFWWQFRLVVMSLGTSTKLLYVELS